MIYEDQYERVDDLIQNVDIQTYKYKTRTFQGIQLMKRSQHIKCKH